MWNELKRDVRYALRILLRNPGFTSISVLTLALCIGLTTAIFSLVENILIRSLPYPDSNRLVSLVQSYSQIGLDTWHLSPADFALYRDRNSVFASVAAYWVTGANLTGVEKPERLVATQATADFFKVLEINPILGRTFAPGEDTPGKTNVCVLSYSFWTRHFSKDERVIGKVMVLNNAAVQIVGVMPETFEFPAVSTEIWLPLELNSQAMHPYFLSAIGRLKPASSPQLAQVETTQILWSAGSLNPHLIARNEPPPRGADLKTLVVPLKESIVGKVATPLLVLQSAVGFILLMACANITNLLLSRTSARTREVALRCAMGCTLARIVKQLLTESVLLSIFGAVPGILLAWMIVRAIGHMPVGGIPRLDEVSVDATVLLVALGVAIVTGLLISIVPSLKTIKSGLKEGLNNAQRGSSEESTGWIRGVVVGGQVALCLILLIGAALLLKSFQRIVHVQPGFEPQHVLTMFLPVTNQKYSTPDQALQFYHALQSDLSAMPGVSSVSVSSNIPFSGQANLDGYIVEGHEPPPGAEPTQAQLQTVSPVYFRSMGMSLLGGRDFLETDQANSPPVAIVDKTLAEKYWLDGHAVGHRIRTTGDNTWMTIVGIVNGVKDQNLVESMKPHLYFPHSQDPQLRMNLVVRTSGSPLTVVSAVRDRIRTLDPDIPLYAVRQLTDVLGQALDRQKFIDGLLTVFALLALVLAVIGIYGVVSVYVTNRTREFGIRMALGAQASDILYLVLKQGLLLILSGIAAGLIGAFVLTKSIASLLYDVSVTDTSVFSFLPILLAMVALTACYLPARKAARSDPNAALRYE